MSKPLEGVRVVELSAIGPAPFAGMMLADMGAEVIRVGRLAGDDAVAMAPTHGVLNRGRRFVQLDLKRPGAAQVVQDLARHADIVTEGFRPGVAERLGVGPQDLQAVNPALVYGRMTGWGQDGPRAPSAGHDLGYIALSGALGPCVGSDGKPVQPLNMLGDFGGGGMLLVSGVLAALLAAERTGRGRVVDAAIVDGAALLTAMHQAMLGSGLWSAPPGGNVFDGGAPFYALYRTKDDRWLSVAAMEPKFYAQLLAGLQLSLDPNDQQDQASWPQQRAAFAARVAERSRAEWLAVFDGLDACVAPVLDTDELLTDEHLAARGVYRDVEGVLHPAPAPRFDGVAAPVPDVATVDQTRAVLRELGYDEQRVADLAAMNVIAPEVDSC